jgi:hypothetical protein
MNTSEAGLKKDYVSSAQAMDILGGRKQTHADRPFRDIQVVEKSLSLLVH